MPRNGNPDDWNANDWNAGDSRYGEPTQYASYGDPTRSADYSSGQAYSEYPDYTNATGQTPYPTGQNPYPAEPTPPPPADPWYRKPAGLMALGALAVVIAALVWCTPRVHMQ